VTVRNRKLVSANELIFWPRETLSWPQGNCIKIVGRLSKNLQVEFPGVEGFSPRSLLYKRIFAEAWPDEPILQQLAAKLPLGHHMALLDRVKQSEVREWYLRAALQNDWSRNVLVHIISGQLREREGKVSEDCASTGFGIEA
jgi:predicted nuclease of restriction endonuclease-like (RecB) superfamily